MSFKLGDIDIKVFKSWVKGFYPGKMFIRIISGYNDDNETNSNFGSFTSWFDQLDYSSLKPTGQTAKIRIHFNVIIAAGNIANKPFSWIKAPDPGHKHLDRTSDDFLKAHADL